MAPLLAIIVSLQISSRRENTLRIAGGLLPKTWTSKRMETVGGCFTEAANVSLFSKICRSVRLFMHNLLVVSISIFEIRFSVCLSVDIFRFSG